MKWFLSLIIALCLISASCSQQQSAAEYIQKGQTYFDKKDWKSAIIEFKNAVTQAPENPQARALLGKSYIEAFNINGAIKELNRARDLGYEEKEVIFPLGKAYLQSGKFQNIIDEVNLKENYPNTLKADILAVRAIAYLSLGNRDAAKQALIQARKNDEDTTDVRLAWAWYEKQNGNIDAQKKWLAPLLDRDGGVADAWSQMGEIEISSNDPKAAEKAYSRAIELRGLIHVDYAHRARIRLAAKNYEGAQEDIDVLNKAGANWPIVGHMDGMLALQAKNVDKAKSLFQDVLSKSPNYAPTQYMLALVYFNNRKFQQAKTLLKQYKDANPEDFGSDFLYANTLMNLNQVENAVLVLEKLHDKGPENFRVLSLLGNAYLRQQQYENAIEVLQKAVKLQPDQAVTRLQLGSSLLSNEATTAEGQLELLKALELNPELLQAELTLFRSYLREKRYSDARLVAKNLDKKYDDSSQGANLVALTYLAEEQKAKAVSLLKAALNRFPGDFLTSHNLARIYLQENKVAEAKFLYEKVLEKETTQLQSLNQLALIAAREGDQKQLMLRLQQAHERNPQLLSPKIALALQFVRQGKANQAVQILTDVTPEQKQQTAYILAQAQAKLAAKEYRHAIRLLKSLKAGNPEIPAVHFLLAQGYAQEKNPKEMRNSLQDTIDLSPDHLMANIILAKLDLFERKFDAFKKRVAILTKAYPDNADVQFMKAKVASGESNYDGAIETLSSLMEQTPHLDVAIDLSRNQWQSGDRQGAISGLELWTQSHTDDLRASVLLAQFYLADENRHDDARILYEKLAVQAKNDPVVLNNLAWLSKETNPQQGIIYAMEALKLSSENAFIKDTLAMLYMEIDEYAKALDLSGQAAKAMPNSGDIQLNYAKVLIANNQRPKAKQILDTLYKKSTSENEKQLIRKEMNKL